MLVDATRKLSTGYIESLLCQESATQPLPKIRMLEIYKMLSDLGMIATRLPVQRGGGNLSMVDYGLMIEQLPPVIALSLISHDSVIARIDADGSDALKKTFLPDLLTGRKIACSANSEDEAGSDANAIRTRIEVEGQYAYLTGRKVWISNASICDVVIVSCIDQRIKNERLTTCRVVVEVKLHDMEVYHIRCAGLKQAHLGEMIFKRTMTSVAHIFEKKDNVHSQLVQSAHCNRPLLGLVAVHMAQRALDMARSYATVRQQFGKTLDHFQLIQKDLADIESAVISSRLMCLYALSSIDGGVEPSGISAMAKRFSTQHTEVAINLAIQIHGAMGLSEELGLVQLLADLKMLQVADGTLGILALVQGRKLTGVGAIR